MSQEYFRVFPTQANLIFYQQRVATSIKGLHFLKSKRDVLVVHHREITKTQAEIAETIDDDFMEAILTINRAKFLDVDLFPLSIIDDESKSIGRVNISSKNIVGIIIPTITYDCTYSNEQSLVGLSRGGKAISGIRLAFVNLLKTLVNICSLLIGDVILRHGIEQTTIRTNALEYLVIPRASATVEFLKSEIDEMCREDFYRIKRMICIKLEKAAAEEKEKKLDKDQKDLRVRSTIALSHLNISKGAGNSTRWGDI